MGLPAKLKNFNCFLDGESCIGKVPEITLPKLTKKVEQYRAGGMLGEVDIEMGMDKLELEAKFGGIACRALRSWGAIGVAGVQTLFVGAYQEDLTGGVLAAELVTQGMIVEVDAGNAKVGDNTEWMAKQTLSYLKWTIAGRVEVEIDLLNCIMIVDGVDRMAAIRAAILQ